MLESALRLRGWPLRDTTPASRLCFDLKSGHHTFVAIEFNTGAVEASAMLAVALTVLGETKFIGYHSDGKVTALYRYPGEPRTNQAWTPKAGGSINIRWGGAPIILRDKNPSAMRWRRHPVSFTPYDLPEASEQKIIDTLDAIDRVTNLETLSETPDPLFGVSQDGLAAMLSPTAKLGAPWTLSRTGVVIRGARLWFEEIIKHWVLQGQRISQQDLEQKVRGNYFATVDVMAPGNQHLIDKADVGELIEKIGDKVFRGQSTPSRALRPVKAQLEICPTEPLWLDDIAPAETRSDIAFFPLPFSRGEDDFQDLGTDSDEARTALMDVVADAIEGFIGDVEHGDRRLRLLNVPPGVGKTTQLVSALLRRRARLQQVQQIALFMPTYENLGETRRLIEDAGLDVVWLPIMNEIDKPALNDPTKIKIMTFGGRIHAGCMIPEKMELAMEVGQGASLCHALDEEGEDLFCPHYSVCPAIAQRHQAQHAEILLMPHQFLVVSPPAELDTIKGVVVDERTDQLFLRTAIIPVGEISAPRRNVKVSKDMAAQGLTSDIMAEARNVAWTEILRVMRDGGDPSSAVARSSDLKRAVTLAQEYCELAKRRDIHISPLTSIEILQAAVERATVKWLAEEIIFWGVIIDDIESGRLYTKRVTILERDGLESIRLSWREKPNWSDRPILMLDGSASAKIVEKIWTEKSEGEGQRVIEHRSMMHEATLNAALPTVFVQGEGYAKSSVVPKNREDDQAILDASLMIDRLRSMIISIAGRNADGRVLVGGMKAVLAALRAGWCEPSNVDFAHYGALRGINAYENHKVAISIGRLEVPPEIIQGATAALSYDDEGEALANNENGQEITLIMRDRRRISVPSQTASGVWERALQVAFREEEMRQFAGRLRAVQRLGRFEEGMSWVVIGNVLPEGSVVDAIVTADDLAADRYFPLLEAARRTGGIIIERKYTDAISDLAAVDNVNGLFVEFMSLSTIRSTWRCVERDVSGQKTRVLVPRHMTSSQFEKQFAVFSVCPTWREMVNNSCWGEDLDESEWGGIADELKQIRESYNQLGLNPETGKNIISEELPLKTLPWPGIDGLLLPARIVMTGIRLQTRYL